MSDIQESSPTIKSIGIINVIQGIALDFLSNKKDGARFSEIKKHILTSNNSFADGTTTASIRDLPKDYPNKITKKSRGLYIDIKYETSENSEPEQTEETKKTDENKSISESDFYLPFADWLTEDREECSRAIPLGGNKFKIKWGTPDVIGITKPKESDIIKFPIEVVSAEIKLDTSALITAFGQACAYKLFSHKVYLVIPKNSDQEDIDRLDSLSMIFGLGLVTYNSDDPKNPEFKIHTRPHRNEPDYFYMNQNIKSLESELFE